METVGSTNPPFWVWILAGAILLVQAIWIYRDASKRGERRILWGLFGLLNVPSSLVVYLLVTRRPGKSKHCPACSARIPGKARFCSECGAAQTEERKQN